MVIGELTRCAGTVGAGAATRADWVARGCAMAGEAAAAAHRQQAPRARARFDIAADASRVTCILQVTG